MSEAALVHVPFTDAERQQEAYSLGLWIFLAGEVLFFGALFCAYAIVRWLHTADFLAGARHTDPVFGTTNTALLITSSVALTIAERASGAHWRGLARAMLALALLLGLAFLAVKGLEYRSDFARRLFPDAGFALAGGGARLFFGFYWVMTGVHAVHLTIGVILVGRLVWMSLAGGLAVHRLSVRLTILYWHFVDAVWIVLFPLLYLAGRP